MSRLRVGFEFEFYSENSRHAIRLMLRPVLQKVLGRENVLFGSSETDPTERSSDTFYLVDDSSIYPPYTKDNRYIEQELVTPAVPYKKSIELLYAILEFLRAHAHTNYSCGLHVNISFNSKKQQRVEGWKVLLGYDDTEILTLMRRKNNQYCRSQRGNLIRHIHKQVRDKESACDVLDSIDQYIERYCLSEKTTSVNISKLDEYDDGGWVEFRSMGGKDYQFLPHEIIVGEVERMAKALEISILDTFHIDFLTIMNNALGQER